MLMFATGIGCGVLVCSIILLVIRAFIDQYDVAGLLQTYAERACKVESEAQLKRQIKNLKELLDLRTIRFEDDEDE